MDFGLVQSNPLAKNGSNKKLQEELKAKKNGQMIADSALTSAEKTGRTRYKGSDSFKTDALEFVRLSHISSQAH